MNTRWLGLLGVVGGAALLAVEVRHLMMGTILNGASMDSIDEMFYAIWGLGFMFAFWGIYRLGVTGSKTWMLVFPLIAAVGCAAMLVGSLTDVIGVTDPRTNPIFLVAWPCILIGTLMTAIFALVSRSWAGWRKFTPLAVILAIPLVLVLGPLTKDFSSVLFGLAWIILGLAVMTSEAALPMETVQA